MADLIPPMLIKLQADVNDLKVGLAQAESALKGVDDSVRTASTGMTSFISKMKQVGATMGVAFAGQQIVQFGRDSIMAASNFNEAFSKVSVVFGQNAKEIQKWANTSADSFGMSSRHALDAAGTFGNLFTAFGLGAEDTKKFSTSLTELAVDMASFNDMSVDDALTALRSGLSGETEPMKKFGSVLSETRLKTEALSLGLIKNTKEALDPAAKAQAAYSLIMKDTIVQQGDYQRTADGTANTMRRVAEKTDDAMVAFGQGLLPIMNVLLKIMEKGILPAFNTLAKFLKDNQAAVVAFGAVLTAGAAAWGVYTLAVNASTIATKAWTAVTKANPIGLIITAVALLSAGLVTLWTKSDTARKIMIEIGKAGVTAISFIIKMVGELVTGMMKLVTGPMRLLLKGLSMLGVKEAGTALKEINGIIDTTGKFFDDAAKKVDGLKGKLDELAKSKPATEKASNAAKNKAEQITNNAKGGLSDADKKKMEDYKKDIQDIYKDMNEAIADAQERALEQLDQRNERMLEAHKRYDERVAELKDQYNERMANAQERYDEVAIDAFEDRQKRETEILKNYKEQQAEIESDYTNKIANISSSYNEKIADLTQQAEERKNQLIADAAAKRESLTQQSMDRLRNAFASKTGFNIGEAFAGGAKSAEQMLENLKKKLADAKKLQENAAALAGMGYSQTFIEQVVSQGPEAGNKIAEALKKASPESTKEMQELYNQIGDVSENGMDDLAKKMNEGGNLATKELRKAYNQVSIDLANDLKKVNDNLNINLKKAQQDYMMAMAAAAAERARRLEENQKKMEEALAAEKAKFDERMADALKQLTKTREDAQKDLDKGLVDAQKTLTDALEDAQKAYDKAIDKINAATDKKLQALRDKLKEISDLIRSIAGAQAALGALQNAPTVKPIIPASIPGGTVAPSTNNVTNINNNITANTNADPQAIANQIQYAIKYGQVVEIPGSMTVL